MSKNTGKKREFKFTYNMALFLIALAMFLGVGIARPNFFSPLYVAETAKQVIEIGIMVLPATLIIISGGIDFSMNALLILSAIVSSIVARSGNVFTAILVSLAIGAIGGLFNGVMIAEFKLPPLIMTLATMYLYKGTAEGLTMGVSSVGASVTSFDFATALGNATVLGIPVQVIVFVVLAVIFHLLLSKTCYGRYIYTLGLNEAAARYSGVKVNLVKISLYVIGGICYSIAGLVYLGRFSALRYDSADPLTLQVITIVLLGGTSILGGSGSIIGSVLAVVIMAIIKSGMNILFIPQTSQKIVLGVILLASLMIFQVIDKRSTSKVK